MRAPRPVLRWPFIAAFLIATTLGLAEFARSRHHIEPPAQQFGLKRRLQALHPDSTPADTEMVGGVVVQYPPTDPRSVLDVPVDSMAVAVNDGLRLKPDIRFVAAVAHVHEILTGKTLAPVTLIPRATGWDIQYRGELAGTLPDLPSFRDGEAMLSAWAAHIQPTAPAGAVSSIDTSGLSADIDEFDAVHIARTLHVVDTLWRTTRDPRLLPIAARGLVSLDIQTIDRTDVADGVPTQALAVTVLAHVPSERALLASEMGYYGEAVTMADSLNAQDPVRLYLMDDRAPIERAGTRSDAPGMTRFLYLRRLAYDQRRADDRRRVARYIRERYRFTDKQLPIFSVGLQMGDFDWDRALPAAVPMFAALDLARITHRRSALDTTMIHWVARLALQKRHVGARDGTVAPIPAGESLQAIADAESVLDTLFPGPLADGATFRDYFRAHLDGAVAAACDHELEEYSNAAGVADLVSEYSTAPIEAGGAVAKWCAHARAAQMDPTHPNDFLADSRDPTMGKALRLEAFERVERANVARSDEVSEGAAYLVSRLDSRPDLLWNIGYRLEWTPRALAVAEQLYRRYSTLVPTPGHTFNVAYAAANGDDASLVALATDQRAQIRERVWALQGAVRDSAISPDRARAIYAQLAGTAPDLWDIREPYIAFLEHMHDYAGAAAIARDWIAVAHRDTIGDAFDWTYAHADLARILDEQGRNGAAWRTIAPFISSDMGRALDVAALIAEHHGCALCSEAADSLSRQSVERYPDGPSEHAIRLYVLWHQGQYANAASHFSSLSGDWSSTEWKTPIDSMFVSAFKDKDAAEVTKAARALLDAQVPLWNIGNLADAADQEGRPDLAFAVQSLLHRDHEGPNRSVGPRFMAYRYLMHWKGADTARAWLLAAVPRPFDDAMAMDAYTLDKSDDLLWTMPLSESSSVATWLYRAAASVRRRTADPHHAELVAYFSDPSHALFAPEGDSAYYTFGRYLLGLADARAMYTAMSTPQHRCEGAYYIGLRAQHDGRYAEAVDWYRASVATRLKDNAELYWAQTTLDDWIELGKNLGYLQKHGL